MVDVTTPVPDGTVIGVVIGGKMHGYNLLNDTAGADAMGLVTATPAANTMLGRLKAIETAIGAATYYPATQPVSGTVGVTGTFWQATQPVSGTVGVSGSVAVTGTFFQATQPISAAALPLPSGAATASGVASVVTALGSPFQAGGSIGNTTFASTQSGAWNITNITGTISLPTGAATSAKQDTGNTSLGSIDTKLSGTLAVAPVAGENHIGAVGGHSAVVTQTFSRPANSTPYVLGDLVANSTTAGSVTPLSLAAARVNAGTGCIRRVRLSTTKTGLAGSDVFRVHFFSTTPTVDNGDNGAFAVNGRASGHLGYVDVVLDRVFNDGACGIGVPASGSEITFVAGGGVTTIFALIEVRGAYTPASGETFVVAAEVFRD